jgi:hypothetical protein
MYSQRKCPKIDYDAQAEREGQAIRIFNRMSDRKKKSRKTAKRMTMDQWWNTLLNKTISEEQQ